MQGACAVLSSVACPAVQNFFLHDLTKSTIFEKEKKVIGRKMCVLTFCTILSEVFFFMRRTERYMVKKYIYLLTYSMEQSPS